MDLTPVTELLKAIPNSVWGILRRRAGRTDPGDNEQQPQ